MEESENQSDVKQTKQKLEELFKDEVLEHLNILSMNNLELLDHIMSYIDFKFSELSCVSIDEDMERAFGDDDDDRPYAERGNMPFDNVSDMLKDVRVKDGEKTKKLSIEEINKLYNEFNEEQKEKRSQTS